MHATRGLPGWALLFGALVLLAGSAVAGEGRVPLPVVPKGQGDQCVEPTPVMRRDHMEFLLHQRDETMHRGIRTKRHSLNECIECHVGRDAHGRTVAVNAPDQFCESCHRYAGVSIDCFQCHATTPDSGGAPRQAAAHRRPSERGGTPHPGMGRLSASIGEAR